MQVKGLVFLPGGRRNEDELCGIVQFVTEDLFLGAVKDRAEKSPWHQFLAGAVELEERLALTAVDQASNRRLGHGLHTLIGHVPEQTVDA